MSQESIRGAIKGECITFSILWLRQFWQVLELSIVRPTVLANSKYALCYNATDITIMFYGEIFMKIRKKFEKNSIHHH